MISVDRVTKRIRKRTVLSNIDLTFEKGTATLLTGPNGCGKTMVLRLLCKLIQPTEGSVSFENDDSTFGVIIETPSFLPAETGLYNLHYLASIRKKIGNDTIDHYLDRFGLSDRKKEAVRKYSLGMRQRLALCQSLMEDPEIILLDEPFNAHDTKYLEIALEELETVKKKGKVIVVASHGFSMEHNTLFDRKIVMGEGFIESVEELSQATMA